jgi:hypothetical protein
MSVKYKTLMGHVTRYGAGSVVQGVELLAESRQRLSGGTGGLTMNKCGDCVFLEKDDGFPYCVTLPLYTERDPDDAACEYFVDGRDDDGRD